MPVLCPFTTKRVEEAALGELIAFPVEQGGEFALKIMQNELGFALLAVFSGGSSATPHMSTVNSEADCISYGTNWLFEIGQAETFSTNDGDVTQPGTAVVSGNQVLLRFGRDPNNIENSGRLLDLSTLTPVRTIGYSYGTRAWKLWATPDERVREGGRPLVERLID
ncbi:hypothetical protein GOL96_25620 [Sinorhizobium medicae]|nr:hypothetical protein [Sinorhizobium medicae]MDX1237195.1 hypothetical protein [Sinorhizobium medicae]